MHTIDQTLDCFESFGASLSIVLPLKRRLVSAFNHFALDSQNFEVVDGSHPPPNGDASKPIADAAMNLARKRETSENQAPSRIAA